MTSPHNFRTDLQVGTCPLLLHKAGIIAKRMEPEPFTFMSDIHPFPPLPRYGHIVSMIPIHPNTDFFLI